MEPQGFQATVHVSNTGLQQKLEQARELLHQSRYKQAIRALENVLSAPVSVVERLQVQAELALAQALWKKPEAAIEQTSSILAAVRADTDDLGGRDIDWTYELSQDIGYLAFLAEVYQLRGMMHLLRQSPRRAVEDFSLSLFMTAKEADGRLNYLQRALALIELSDCFERALADLRRVWELDAGLVRAWFHLPAEGEFALHAKGIVFRAPDRELILTADKARPRLNKVDPAWFRLSQRVGL